MIHIKYLEKYLINSPCSTIKIKTGVLNFIQNRKKHSLQIEAEKIIQK